MILRTLLISVFLSALSSASEVLQASKNAVFVSHPAQKPYAMNEVVCVTRNKAKIACGRVAKSGPKGAIVRLSASRGTAQKGDRAIRIDSGNLAPAKTTSRKTVQGALGPRNTFGLGFLGGSVYQYTLAFYERALSEKVSIRIEPTYFLASLQVASDVEVNSYSSSTLGAKIGVSLHARSLVEGLWAHAGVGYYSFSITPLSQNIATLDNFGVVVASALLGYRFRLGPLFSLGLSVGGQYLPFSESFGVDSLQPIGAGSLSIVF